VLQVAEVTFEPLHLPEWWMTALTILAILGLPIVVVLAWAYDITPGGIVLDTGGRGIKLPRARQAIAPVALTGVTLMAAATGFAWWQRIGSMETEGSPAAQFEPSPYSIAVLPMTDMSPSKEAVYLGDGLSEELSSDLAKLPGLRVAARTSAFAFRGQDLDVRKIGQKLGVRYVLEGSVRREGERVRITAQLIDAISGFHIWTESYDRPWQDLIQIQQSISRAIADELQIVLTPEQAVRFSRTPTANPRAYDFYLAGLGELRRGGGMSQFDEAEELFRQALQADPRFAQAQAGLCQVGITRYSRTRESSQMHEAETACREALKLDAGLRETEHALAKLYLASGRNEQAEAVYRSLLTSSPRDAEVYIGIGKALAAQNRDEEAERNLREAIVVEPGYWMTYNSLGAFLIEHGRSREAAEAFQRVTQLVPGNSSGFNNYGAALLAAGDLGASAEAFEQSLRIEPGRSAYSNLGTIYYYLGRMDEAAAMYSLAIESAPEDFQLWGSRGDAQWYIPTRREQSLQDYRRAITLAEQALSVNDTQPDTWALLGYYYGRVGEQEQSRRYLARATDLGEDRPFVTYCAALAASDRGERGEAERLIARAIAQGYSKVLAVPDPGLKGIPIS
jgi:TolB-like protein/tetratricopeptide (TPR) repeat protein